MVNFFTPLLNLENNDNIRFKTLGHCLSRFFNFGQRAYVIESSTEKDLTFIRIISQEHLQVKCRDYQIVTISLAEKIGKVVLIGSFFALAYVYSRLFLAIPAAILIANAVFRIANCPFQTTEFERDLDAWVKNDNPIKANKCAAEKIKQAFYHNERSLDLTGGNLTDLPSCLSKLSHLKSLSLKWNCFISLPICIGQLPNLESLDITRNYSLISFPSELCALKNLKSIYMWDTKIEKFPDELGNLSSLEKLCAYGNELNSIPTSLGKLSNLIELNLSHNKLESLPDLSKLTNLTSLSLGANKFTKLPSGLEKLSNLKILKLSGHKLTCVPLTFDTFQNLKRLYLDNNPDLSELPQGLEQIRSLEFIDIKDTKIDLTRVQEVLSACKLKR